MPAPITTDELMTNIRKSGLIPPAQLDSLRASAPAEESTTAFLERLVQARILTRYQSEKLAVGKYKGFVLGPYVILDRLGGGGMGHVFLAQHTTMKRKVALKVLSIDSANDPVARERFFREARVSAGLDHPNIIRVFDMRREDAICYLVMEYVEGDSLQHIVSRHGPLPFGVAADYARQVAIGLQHAHENGLVHRDIKPANLLLSPDGTVKIIDLGLVRWEPEVDSKLTEKIDQSILGTADYLAPEQAVNSSNVDIRADIYSLGATLYFLLAGRPMFPEGKTAQKLMWQQLKTPEPIRGVVCDVPEGLAAVLHRCLAKSPNDRFIAPHELAEALAPWCNPMPPDPAWFPGTRRRPDTRSLPKRPGLETTMLPPIESVTSSHLFKPRSSKIAAAATPTMSDIAGETPRRWPTPEEAPMKRSALVSRVYVPESELDANIPIVPHQQAVSPIWWVALGAVIALAAVAIVLLLK